MRNYSFTVNVACQCTLAIENCIRELTPGISIATELDLRIRLAANLIFKAFSDPQLPVAPEGSRILYVFTLPEFFFRTIGVCGFDLLDAPTRAALSLAPLPSIPPTETSDIQVPATDSYAACITIALQVGKQLTALAHPRSKTYEYLMDSVLFLGSAVMYAGHYKFTTGRTARKVDGLALTLRLYTPNTGGLPTWSVHLTWKILNSNVDTIQDETTPPGTGLGKYAPAPGQSHYAVALSRTLMHASTERSATGKMRRYSLESHVRQQFTRTYPESQYLPDQPSALEYLKHAAANRGNIPESSQNRIMALKQLGLNSVRSQGHMAGNAGNGTWLSTSGGTVVPSHFLQPPNAFTDSGTPICIYTEICVDHSLNLFHFLSELRPPTKVHLMILISAGVSLQPTAFAHLPPSTGNFVVFHNDAGGDGVHNGVVNDGVLEILDLWNASFDKTSEVEAIIRQIIPPSPTRKIPLVLMDKNSVVIAFSNIFPID